MDGEVLDHERFLQEASNTDENDEDGMYRKQFSDEEDVKDPRLLMNKTPSQDMFYKNNI